MSPEDAATLSFWKSASLWGMILVWIGVALEGAAVIAFSWSCVKMTKLRTVFTVPPEPHVGWKMEVVSAVGWGILVVGLSLELPGHIFEQRITEKENRRLDSELANAVRIAGLANERASTNELRAAQADLARVELEKQIADKFRIRSITPEQFVSFLDEVKAAPKQPIWVLTGSNSGETLALAMQFRTMLDVAGYPAEDPAPFNKESGSMAAKGIFCSGMITLTVDNVGTFGAIVVNKEDLDAGGLPSWNGIIKGFKAANITCSVISFPFMPKGHALVFIPPKVGF